MDTITLYILYSEVFTPGEVSPWEDPEYRYACHEDSVRENIPHAVFKTPKHGGNIERVEVRARAPLPDEFYLVRAVYRDGDTFGATRGNYHYVSAHLLPEAALESAREILRADASSDYSWVHDYFASLEHVEIYLVEGTRISLDALVMEEHLDKEEQ